MAEAVVRCRRPFDFGDDAYRHYDDQFRNAVLFPPALFEEIGAEPYGYVRVTPIERNGGAILYAAPFDPVEDVSDPDGLRPVAIRTNLSEQVRPGIESGDRLRVEAVDQPESGSITVARGYDDNRGAGICYLQPSLKRELGVAPDGPVELYDPASGGRAILDAADLPEDLHNRDVVRIDGHIQQALQVEFGNAVRARKPVEYNSGTRSPLTRVLEWLIDYREVHLRVELGLDRDEYRNVVRMQQDTMEFLGIEPGDRIVMRWNGERVTTQCLLPPDGVSVPEASLLIASTDRDAVDVSLYDTVVVRRDMGHVFRKRISLSTLGILGVVFGTFQVAGVAGFDDVLRADIGPYGTMAVLLGTAVVVSVFVMWLLLLPERQRCSRPSTEVR